MAVFLDMHRNMALWTYTILVVLATGNFRRLIIQHTTWSTSFAVIF